MAPLLFVVAVAIRFLSPVGAARNQHVQTHHGPRIQARLPLLPYPAEVKVAASDAKPFELKPGVAISIGEGIDKDGLTVTMLKDLLNSASKGNGSGAGGKSAFMEASALGSISLRLAGNASAGSTDEQGYKLRISDKTVELEAPSPAGLFYGAQTLRQLASEGSSRHLPAATISDSPRFVWRGLHLDVSRHFFTADQVKQLLNVMSLYKMNRFHWHLTDDQGWRLPVESYPKLTSVGGKGKAYTKEEIKDVVAYALERSIEVVPEVDVPGHVQAALFAYPDLGNSDIEDWQAPEDVMQEWGISDYTLAPSNASLDFLGKVFDTLAELFPSKIVHMGGDEVRLGQWSQSKAADAFLAQGSGDEAGRGNNSIFIQRVEDRGMKVAKVFNKKLVDLVKSRGRKVAAWDEAQHTGSFPDDGIVMAWNSEQELSSAVQAGRPAINANIGVLYFDHAQGSSEPVSQGGCTSWQGVYSYELMPADLTKAQEKLVLGAQGQLWSEYFPNWTHVEYMAHPRSLALAEKAWTPKGGISSEAEFEVRLRKRLGDLDALGVKYRKLTTDGCSSNLK